MASSDDIERAMRQQIADERQQQSAEERRLAERAAAGAQAARGFIELMRKRGVAPESIYRYEQIVTRRRTLIYREEKRSAVVERYEWADHGWVVQWSITEYNEPWLIRYLRPDGLINDCEVRRWPDLAAQNRFLRFELPVEGLLQGPSFGIPNATWLLCLKRAGDRKPHSPSLTVDDYAAAARHYLS